jgi:hypothetical protein
VDPKSAIRIGVYIVPVHLDTVIVIVIVIVRIHGIINVLCTLALFVPFASDQYRSAVGPWVEGVYRLGA